MKTTEYHACFPPISPSYEKHKESSLLCLYFFLHAKGVEYVALAR